jgi:hypothetical protein
MRGVFHQLQLGRDADDVIEQVEKVYHDFCAFI